MSQMSSALTIDLVLDETVSTIVLNGDMDLATADALLTTAQPAFGAGAAPVVAVDLSGVAFCDSAGLSALVQLRKLADLHGQELRVVKAREAVWRVLDYSGLREYLRVE